MAGFLTDLHVRQYACIQDARCTLTPLHAFIGPNDSGKSTLLKAIESLLRGGYSDTLHVLAGFGDGSKLCINWDGERGSGVILPGAVQAQAISLHLQQEPISVLGIRVGVGWERAQFVRLDPDDLRKASRLIPFGTPLALQGRGSNLAGLYDALRDRSVDRFIALSKQVSELFPTVKSLGLRALATTEKVLTVTLTDGVEVLSESMSEGLLYYLAFAILAELERPAVYLVEEPETGLHPSRIADIVRTLRAIAEDATRPVQVLMATHSPLVINELRPEEVTIVTRDPVTGTRLRPIQSTPHFEERSQVYALGELWLSYADGKLEAPLFDNEGR